MNLTARQKEGVKTVYTNLWKSLLLLTSTNDEYNVVRDMNLETYMIR